MLLYEFLGSLTITGARSKKIAFARSDRKTLTSKGFQNMLGTYFFKSGAGDRD
jgi:hypothetical protein